MSVIYEWKRLDKYISDNDSLGVFKSALLKLICPSRNSSLKIINSIGIQLLRQIRVGFVLFTLGNKFIHDFQDLIHLLCTAAWRL